MFAVERTANIKVNPLQTPLFSTFMLVGILDSIHFPGWRMFFTFCPLSRKLREKSP
jgi:hypothetical protein